MLVLDDEEHVTAALCDYFANLGYAVDRAASEQSALALLDDRDYTALITDLRLSGSCRLEGLDVISHFCARNPAAACIVLTAYSDFAVECEARRRGAHAFVQKPWPLPALAELVARIQDSRLTRTRT